MPRPAARPPQAVKQMLDMPAMLNGLWLVQVRTAPDRHEVTPIAHDTGNLERRSVIRLSLPRQRMRIRLEHAHVKHPPSGRWKERLRKVCAHEIEEIEKISRSPARGFGFHRSFGSRSQPQERNQNRQPDRKPRIRYEVREPKTRLRNVTQGQCHNGGQRKHQEGLFKSEGTQHDSFRSRGNPEAD